MGEHASWRHSLAELGLDAAERHLLGAGQPLQDPPTKRKFSNNGQEAQESKRRQWRPNNRDPIVDTPPTPAPLSDGPDFWTGAPAGDGAGAAALRPQLARQLGHCIRPAADAAGTSGGSGQRQPRAAAAALGWRTVSQRSFPPSGGGLEVQEISSELWQEQEHGQEQERSGSLESCGGLSAGGVLVQEAETDPESVPGTPRLLGTPEPARGEHCVSIVELHFAEEEREELWEQETDETEELLVLSEPTLGAAAVKQGGDERALFSLQSIRRLMQPVRRCLSPMAEESCEEMDWSESRPLAEGQRGELEEEASSSSETLHVQENREEKTCSESLPVESRVREGTEKEETRSESLPVESRTRGNVSRIEESSESLPVESRIRCEEAEEEVFAESLPVESRLPEHADCETTCSESLPVKTRVRGEDCTGKDLTNGLSDESMTSSDESLKNESRSVGKEDAAEPSQTSGRLTRHRTSWSLPNAAVKYDFKTSFISRTNGAPSNSAKTEEDNNDVTTRVSWSLPNEARMRETKGSPGSVTKEPRKRDPDSSVTTKVSSSLPNETRSRESRRKKVNVLSGSIPNEARVKEEGSESLPNEVRLRQSGNEAERTSGSSLPSETRRRENGEDVKELTSSLPNGTRVGGNKDQPRTKLSLSPSKEDEGSLRQDSREKAENHAQNSSDNVNEEGKVEVIDRTDDKKYNFGALRMKRKQAQLAAKNMKEGAAKSTSIRSSKKSTDSSETKCKPNDSGSRKESRDSGVSRLLPDTTQEGEKRDSAKTSPNATIKSGRSEKNDDSLSTAPRSKTSQEIIEDLESDTSWRTIRSTDSTEHNNKDERLEPPSVVTPLTDLECYVTETLMLTTEIRGQPCPEARWVIKPFLSSQQTTSVRTYMDGQPVETGEHRLLQRQGRHRHRLVIPRLNYIDAGRYTVTLSNCQGEAASQCKVVVKPLTELKAPHFFTPLVARTVREGEKTEFSCEVRGSPLPSVTWFKDSVELSAGPTLRMTYKLITGLCSLTLLRPQVGDDGKFTCRASNQHGYTELQTTLKVLENERLPSSDSTKMAPQDTGSRLSAEEAPPDTTTPPSCEEPPSSVTSHPAEEAVSVNQTSRLKEGSTLSVPSSHPSAMPESRDIPSRQNGEVKPSGITSHSAKDVSSHDTESCSSEGASSGRITRQITESSLSDISSCLTEEVAPPGTRGSPAEEVAPSDIRSSPSERQQAQSPATTSSPTASSGRKSHTTRKPATIANTSSCSVKSPVVIEHPIVATPLPDKSSVTESRFEKSSKEPAPVEQSSKEASIVEQSPGKVQAVNKPSGVPSTDVRSHPIELTLPSVRSHPIQVPSSVEMSHPIEVDPPVSTSKAKKRDRRPVQPNASPTQFDRLRQPAPGQEEEEEEREADQARLAVHDAPPPPPPPQDGADHQLTAGGVSGTDATDTTERSDTTDAPTTVPRPACQPRSGREPEAAVVTGGRPRGAAERLLSKPPPVISWRSDARPVLGSARVKNMTSPEGEAVLEAVEETETNDVTAASEEAGATEPAEPAVEAVAAEETPAAEEPAPPPEDAPAPAAEPASLSAEPAALEEDPPSVQPPSVEDALLPVQAVAGCPARLEGRVSGLPKPTIAWTLDGVTLHPDGERLRQYHHDDGTFGLEIAESRAEDVGMYAVTAVNLAGQAATEAAFQLLDTSTAGKEWAPDFTTPLLGAKVDEGGTIELDTHVTGVPLPEISWTKNGVPLEAGERVTLGYDSDKATLSITPAERSDAGKYEITIKNKLGEVSSAVKVKVNKIYTVPQFAEKLMDVQQVTSLDAKLSCRVTALPMPEVQWLFNDQPLKSSKKHKIRRDEDTCTLSVRDCSGEDVGTYTCRATNSEGTANTSADLRVVDKLERKPKLEAPLFLKTIGDCEVFPGMQAKFTGCVAGNPEPECEWYRNDVRLYPSDRIVVENDGSGLVRLTLRTVDETDVGRYRLRIRSSEGEAACESDLTYDSFENTPTKPLKDQYHTLERQLKSGIPMPLPDPPIVSRMSDRQLTLSWKPSPAAGQHIPPTYTVEMAKMPEGGFAVVNTGVRGCSVEIKRLEPQCDYKFRVIVENKHGASEPSPHTVAHRIGLVPATPPENPCLPVGDTFRADSSPLFPRGFDMDKHTGGKGHPPTNGVSRDAHGGEEDDSWRYDRFDPDAHTSRLASQRLVQPFPAEFHPPAVVPQSSEPRPPRPRDAQPPSARLRPLSDDVDGYVPPSGSRPRRVAHGEEWETKRGSNIVERLLVRRQMEEAGKSFKRAAGLETRNMARFMKPRASERISERLSERRWEENEDREVPRSTLGSVRATRSYIPSRTAAEIIGSDDDDLDAPSPSLYTRPSHHSRAASVLDEDFDAPSAYSRGVGSSRHARAASILDDDEDDDDLEIVTRRRPAPHHTRTATLLAAANDSDDEDMTPYLRRTPRLLGTRDWGVPPARSVRASRSPVSSGRDRDYQERRERHQEFLNSRNRDISAVPTVTPDWQGELERHLRGRGLSSVKDTKRVSSATAAKEAKSLDTSSVRDWESRFAADV